MTQNLELANKILEKLIERGICNFVICPGSFNSPFLALLSKIPDLKLYNHFDERGAAFFALGLSKQCANAACICITSGTAVAECLPAVIEAYYGQKGLLVLSADREKSLSASGYPQAINQAGILSSHCEATLDIESEEDIDNLPALINLPVHCNVRFKEPILTAGFSRGHFPEFQKLACNNKARGPVEPGPPIKTPDNNCSGGPGSTGQGCHSLNSFLAQHKRPLVIIEDIPTHLRDKIQKFICRLGAPVIAEARSGFRESSGNVDLVLRLPDILLRKPLFDCVIRIGAVPSSDLWRAFEREPGPDSIPVCSLTTAGRYPGLSRQSICLNLDEASFECEHPVKDTDWVKSTIDADRSAFHALARLLNKYPGSEQSLVNWFSRQIPVDSFLYLGNSLPIREWNQFADTADRNLLVDANRGANGIDGQLATFLGAAAGANRPNNWALIGDLTFLYDCNSLALAKSLSRISFRVGLINNRGGRIFEQLPYLMDLNETAGACDRFLNVQQFDFEKIASGFGLEILRIEKPLSLENLPKQAVLELYPSLEETNAFKADYLDLIKAHQ